MKKALLIALILLPFFSRTSSAQWQPLALPFESYIPDFLNDTVGYLLSVESQSNSVMYVNRTADGGKTWQVVDSTTFANYSRPAVDLNFLSSSHGFSQAIKAPVHLHDPADILFEETTDSGHSWNRINLDVSLFRYGSKFIHGASSGRIVLLSEADGYYNYAYERGFYLYRSQNNGQMPFEKVMDAFSFTNYKISHIRSYDEDQNGNALAVLLDSMSRSIVVRKLVDDYSWTVLNVLDTSTDLFGFAKAIKHTSKGHWLAATDSGIYISSDTGLHWSVLLRTSIPVMHIDCDSLGRICATLATDRYLIASSDYGLTWRREVLPDTAASGVRSPTLVGKHTTIVQLGRYGLAGALINRSSKPQRVGSLYLDTSSIELGFRPKNDSFVHRLVIHNDDTTAWTIKKMIVDNPHFHWLDSTVVVPPNDSAFVRFTFGVTQFGWERANVQLITNDSFKRHLVCTFWAQPIIPKLALWADPDYAILQLGQTIVIRYQLQNVGRMALNISNIQLTATDATILELPQPSLPTDSVFNLDISIKPTHAGIDSGRIIVRSNSDPTGIDTIIYHLQVGNDRVRTAWSKVLPVSTDTNASYASVLALNGHASLLVGLHQADSTKRGSMVLAEFDSAGVSGWSHAFKGEGSWQDTLSSIVTDSKHNIYFSATLATAPPECIVASFDSSGHFNWTDTVWSNYLGGSSAFTTFVDSQDNVVQIAHGFAGQYMANYQRYIEMGQIGILRTDLRNQSPAERLINGNSSVLAWAGRYGYTENMDDFPFGAQSDANGGFYVLCDFSVSDTSIGDGYLYPDYRKNVLFHFSGDLQFADWTIDAPPGRQLFVDIEGNAVICEDSAWTISRSGKLINVRWLGNSNFYVRAQNGDYISDEYSNGLRRITASGIIRTIRRYNNLSVEPGQVRIYNPLLLTDAQSNVYLIGNCQTGDRQSIAVTKFDSLGMLRWTITRNGAFRDIVYDAVLDPRGPIYVCGGTADSGGQYRPLIWKIDQDPIPEAVAQAEKPGSEISAYPNPFTREVVATVPNSIGSTYDYALIDVLGRKIATGTNLHARTIKLNGESLAEGVYLLRISDGAGNVVEGKLMHRR